MLTALGSITGEKPTSEMVPVARTCHSPLPDVNRKPVIHHRIPRLGDLGLHYLDQDWSGDRLFIPKPGAGSLKHNQKVLENSQLVRRHPWREEQS